MVTTERIQSWERGVALASVLALSVAVLSAGPGQKTESISIAGLYDKYAAGDYDVVGRTLKRSEQFPATLDEPLKSWRSNWSPVRATFLLEMAIAAADAQASETLAMILSAGGSFVIQRPMPPGVNDAIDRYELLWHRAAIGLLQQQVVGLRYPEQGVGGRSVSWEEDTYINTLEKRYTRAGQHMLDGHLALARAIARTHECCTVAVFSRVDDEAYAHSVAGAALDPNASRDLQSWGAAATRREAAIDAAIHAFDAARAFPDTRIEANVRGAFLLCHRGRASEALKWLDDVPDDLPDHALIYWAHLVRGRAFDALNRIADSEKEYRAALAVWPQAQSAGVGLALNLLRQSRYDEAALSARATSVASYDVDDPWWTFDGADARFVPMWRDELRRYNR